MSELIPTKINETFNSIKSALGEAVDKVRKEAGGHLPSFQRRQQIDSGQRLEDTIKYWEKTLKDRTERRVSALPPPESLPPSSSKDKIIEAGKRAAPNLATLATATTAGVAGFVLKEGFKSAFGPVGFGVALAGGMGQSLVRGTIEAITKSMDELMELKTHKKPTSKKEVLTRVADYWKEAEVIGAQVLTSNLASWESDLRLSKYLSSRDIRDGLDEIQEVIINKIQERDISDKDEIERVVREALNNGTDNVIQKMVIEGNAKDETIQSLYALYTVSLFSLFGRESYFTYNMYKTRAKLRGQKILGTDVYEKITNALFNESRECIEDVSKLINEAENNSQFKAQKTAQFNTLVQMMAESRRGNRNLSAHKLHYIAVRTVIGGIKSALVFGSFEGIKTLGSLGFDLLNGGTKAAKDASAIARATATATTTGTGTPAPTLSPETATPSLTPRPTMTLTPEVTPVKPPVTATPEITTTPLAPKPPTVPDTTPPSGLEVKPPPAVKLPPPTDLDRELPRRPEVSVTLSDGVRPGDTMGKIVKERFDVPSNLLWGDNQSTGAFWGAVTRDYFNTDLNPGLTRKMAAIAKVQGGLARSAFEELGAYTGGIDKDKYEALLKLATQGDQTAIAELKALSGINKEKYEKLIQLAMQGDQTAVAKLKAINGCLPTGVSLKLTQDTENFLKGLITTHKALASIKK